MSKDSRVSCKIEAGSRRLLSITPIGFPLCLLLNPALIAVKSLVLVLWGKISIFSSLPLQTKVPSFNSKDERSFSVFSKAFLIAAVAIRSPTSPSPERLRLRAATGPRTGIKKRMLGKSEMEEMLNPPQSLLTTTTYFMAGTEISEALPPRHTPGSRMSSAAGGGPARSLNTV